MQNVRGLRQKGRLTPGHHQRGSDAWPRAAILLPLYRLRAEVVAVEQGSTNTILGDSGTSSSCRRSDRTDGCRSNRAGTGSRVDGRWPSAFEEMVAVPETCVRAAGSPLASADHRSTVTARKCAETAPGQATAQARVVPLVVSAGPTSAQRRPALTAVHRACARVGVAAPLVSAGSPTAAERRHAPMAAPRVSARVGVPGSSASPGSPTTAG